MINKVVPISSLPFLNLLYAFTGIQVQRYMHHFLLVVEHFQNHTLKKMSYEEKIYKKKNVDICSSYQFTIVGNLDFIAMDL